LIDELLPPGSIDPDVIFVLTNAIYFKSRWASPFSVAATEPGPFVTNSDDTAEALLMHQSEFSVPHQITDDYAAVALPYSGRELELVAIMPAAGTFEEFVDGLDAARIEAIRGGLENGYVDLRFPKFEIEASLPLREHLEALGMVQAFSQAADFGLIHDDAFISDAFHDATIILDEEGTEAAAATAFVGSWLSAPPPGVPLTFDRPFVFYIRDIPTNAILFVGQYVTPD